MGWWDLVADALDPRDLKAMRTVGRELGSRVRLAWRRLRDGLGGW